MAGQLAYWSVLFVLVRLLECHGLYWSMLVYISLNTVNLRKKTESLIAMKVAMSNVQHLQSSTEKMWRGEVETTVADGAAPLDLPPEEDGASVGRTADLPREEQSRARCGICRGL
ncbi:hypothetical protein ACLOJK_033811 [Asimina triloba]